MIALAHGNLATLFVVLAVVSFALAVLAGFRGQVEAAVVLAIVGVLILLFA